MFQYRVTILDHSNVGSLSISLLVRDKDISNLEIVSTSTKVSNPNIEQYFTNIHKSKTKPLSVFHDDLYRNTSSALKTILQNL